MTASISSAVGLRVAEILLTIGAIHVRPEQPFIWTSGRASPVYVDCRKLISFPAARREILAAGASVLRTAVEPHGIDVVAGGETAGIPFAAWLSDAFDTPMLYVRKKPKGFGRDARIEGDPGAGQRAVLVEDLASDGGSKVGFVEALREAGLTVEHVFVIFHYGIYPESRITMDRLGVRLHALATFHDVLEALRRDGRDDHVAALSSFMADPHRWSDAHGGRTAGG